MTPASQHNLAFVVSCVLLLLIFPLVHFAHFQLFFFCFSLPDLLFCIRLTHSHSEKNTHTRSNCETRRPSTIWVKLAFFAYFPRLIRDYTLCGCGDRLPRERIVGLRTFQEAKSTRSLAPSRTHSIRFSFPSFAQHSVSLVSAAALSILYAFVAVV